MDGNLRAVQGYTPSTINKTNEDQSYLAAQKTATEDGKKLQI